MIDLKEVKDLAASTIGVAASAVADGLKYVTAERVTGDVLVKDVKAVINRGSKTEVERATPLSLGDMEQIFELPLVDHDPWRDARDRCILAFGFFGLLRASDVANLRSRGGRVTTVEGEEVVELHIFTAKNDQEGVGAKIYLSPVSFTFCPVKCAKKYGQLRQAEAQPFFYQQKTTGSEVSYEKLTPDRVNNIVKEWASRAGLGEGYTSHSMRRGGATTAASTGVSREDIKHLGRWKSNAVDAYIEVAPKVSMEATRRMTAGVSKK